MVRHLGWKDRKGAPDGVVADLEDKADANRPFEEQCPLSDREHQQKGKRCGETRSRGAHLKNVVICLFQASRDRVALQRALSKNYV